MIFAVERELRGLQIDDPGGGAALLDDILAAGCDDRDVVAGRRADAQLAIDIGLNAAAFGRVEGSDIDDAHVVSAP